MLPRHLVTVFGHLYILTGEVSHAWWQTQCKHIGWLTFTCYYDVGMPLQTKMWKLEGCHEHLTTYPNCEVLPMWALCNNFCELPLLQVHPCLSSFQAQDGPNASSQWQPIQFWSQMPVWHVTSLPLHLLSLGFNHALEKILMQWWFVWIVFLEIGWQVHWAQLQTADTTTKPPRDRPFVHHIIRGQRRLRPRAAVIITWGHQHGWHHLQTPILHTSICLQRLKGDIDSKWPLSIIPNLTN